MPNALDESQVPAEFQDEMNLEVAHHVIKTLRAIGGDLRKTNDRPWNTYIRRPFALATAVPVALEVFRVPAGKYLLIEKITVAPIGVAGAGTFAFQINEQQQLDPNTAFDYATPAAAAGASTNLNSPVFVDSQETVYYWINTVTPGTVVQGCLFGRLIAKDIREGLDITLPEDEANSSITHVRGNL